MRVAGLAMVAIGLVMAANAVVSGPRAFGLGSYAVIGMVAVGVIVAASGAWLLTQKR